MKDLSIVVFRDEGLTEALGSSTHSELIKILFHLFSSAHRCCSFQQLHAPVANGVWGPPGHETQCNCFGYISLGADRPWLIP